VEESDPVKEYDLFVELKADLKRDLRQEEILIVERDVDTL